MASWLSVLVNFWDSSNRPFPHSSQARARKHEREARVDKHQTWRTAPLLLRAVAVANIVVSLVAKVPFITIRGKKLIFHFFLFLWRQKVGIGGFWQLKDKKTEPESEPCYLSSRLLNKDNARPTEACENCAYLRRVMEKLEVKLSLLIKQKSDVKKEWSEL